MKLEEIPDSKVLGLEDLEEELGTGKVHVILERIEFGYGGLASNVGSGLSPAVLERIRDEDTEIVRENGKDRTDPIEVIVFDNEQERKDFLEDFGRGVDTLEKLQPLATDYRKKVLTDISRLNDNLRRIITKINLEERGFEKRIEGLRDLENLLTSREVRNNIYDNMIIPACRNPAILLYFSYSPKTIQHSTDVASLAVAIASLSGIEDRETLEQFAINCILHDISDDVVRSKFKQGSERFNEIYLRRDFLIPRRIFTTGGPDNERYIDGLDSESIEIIEHHHTPRKGRVIELLEGKRVAFYPQDVFNKDFMSSKLLTKISDYVKMEEHDLLETRDFSTVLNQPLYLAERWITNVSHTSTKLSALTEYKKILKEKGMCARDDFVEGLLSIVGEKYSEN